MFSPSSAAAGKTHEQHNAPKHPHAVQGEHRAKHQTQNNQGSPNSRHMLPEAKGVLRVIGSIRPPCVPKPKVDAVRPSRELEPEFVTYSPFDLRFPPYATSRVSSPKSSSVMSSPLRTATAVALMKTASQRMDTKPKVANKLNSRNAKTTPASTKQAGKATPTTSMANVKRLRKQHKHDIPRKVANKNWHLAGWVTYSPFDTNFDRVCYGVNAKHHHAHAHHQVGRPHHPGHHQAHHPHHVMSPAQKMVADFYAQSGVMAFPRMSPTAMNGSMATLAPNMSSFFMPAPTARMPTVNPGASMSGLPGSMRAFGQPTNMPFSSGFAW